MSLYAIGQRVLVHRAHIEKTIALRGIRAKNEGPKSVAHFAVNYYVCATRTHTQIRDRPRFFDQVGH